MKKESAFRWTNARGICQAGKLNDKNGIPGYRNVVDEKDRKILYRNISAGKKGEKPTEVGIA